MWLWIIVALVGAAAFITLLLSVPLDVTLRLDIYGKPEFTLKLGWFFGLVTKEVRRKKGKSNERKPTSKMDRARAIFEILRLEGLPGQLRRLIKEVFSRISVRELKGEFRVGLGNPVETALLFALVGPLSFIAGLSHNFKVTPAFDEAVFEGYLYGEARLHPIRLVIPILRFVFSLAAMRLVKKVALRRWKAKRKYASATP